jgi:Tol biopolymer transport system component/C-terminal processing protease CtpA/Prc
MIRFAAAVPAAFSIGAALLLGAASPRAHAQGALLPLPEDKPIRGMNTPAVSPDGRMVAFVYQGDLWSVQATGGMASRLTVHQAHDTNPRYSPDGRWIAFASNREGNYDVFVIPAGGGSARQITRHSDSDYPMDWSPDGSKILFYGRRGDKFQLYTIDVATSVVKTITNDDAQVRYASFSPDGKTVAYNRAGNTGVWYRPVYRGSANMEIYAKSLADGKLTRISDYEGMDQWPLFAPDGKRVFYVTDRLTPGTPNIVAASASGGKPTLVTKHKAEEVIWPSMARNGSLIGYVHQGDLWTVKPAGGESTKLTIYAPSDDKINNVTRLALTNGAQELEVSPDGRTLALVVRGEIWTIPAQSGGDARRLTTNPAHDHDVLWSKDGKQIAFVSDRNGNFDVVTLNKETREVKQLTNDPNDEESLKYSPDGKMLSFIRNGSQGGIYVMPADASGPPRRVAESLGNNVDQQFNPGVGISAHAWSPDGKWIAFARRDAISTQDVWVVPVAEGGKPVNVTYTPGTNGDPEWTADGKFLLFTSSRAGIPDLYSVRLVPEPESAAAAAPQSGPAAGTGPRPTTAPEVKIDFEDIEDRAKRITTQGVAAYELTPDGRAAVFIGNAGGSIEYFMVPVTGGSAQRLTQGGEGTSSPRFGNDPNVFYAIGQGGTVKAVRRMGPAWGSQTIAFSARMDLDRRAEIRQAFNEFWRRINVGFYDPNMHGVDWRAARARYEPLLEGVGTKEEFAYYLLSPLAGELNASHMEPSPAPGPAGSATAELGLTFDESYTGPGLKVTGYMPKGPNDDLGPRIKPGEFVLAIDGEDVSWNESLYDHLADKAGKDVELLVNTTASKEGARTVKLKAITKDQWRDLDYERKVRERRALVERQSGGRLAYVHIRGMDQPSLRRLERELWGRAREKDGLVLDIRDNGGGNTHEAILQQISRPVYVYQQPRNGPKITEPVRTWTKPIILLINENSSSDAEIFPMGFRTLKLGKIVGVETPGYVIGTYGRSLQDGTGFRIPMWGWFSADGKNLENNGVKPDISVELTPEDLAAKRDRQLEVAVDMVLKELPKK